MVGILNGIAELIWPQLRPKVNMPFLIRREADGRESRVINVTPHIGVLVGGDPTGVLDRLVDADGVSFPGPLKERVYTKLKNERVTNALRVLGLEVDPSWTCLFKVLELIEQDVGGTQGITRRKWTSRSQLSRFTASANSWNASGLEARHAQDWQPPSNAMPIAEARQFIRELVSQWLTSD